jgi:hypothetical protein
MYYGVNMVPPYWPRNANKKTYRKYAQIPAWHVEEAAALVAGYVPRHADDLHAYPLHDIPKKGKPYRGRKTWGQLISGPVGKIMALFERVQRVSPGRYSNDDLYVEPCKFLEFCAQNNIPIPPDLREAVPGAPRRTSSPTLGKRAEKKRRIELARAKLMARYERHAAQILGDLNAAGVRVSIPQLYELVDHYVKLDPAHDRTAQLGKFKGYIEKWRGHKSSTSSLARSINKVLRDEPGRPSDDELAQQKKKMPQKHAQILWPASGRTK